MNNRPEGRTLVLSWDSEYADTRHDPAAEPYADQDGYCPISDQYYSPEFDRHHFLPHVGVKTNSIDNLKTVLADYPDDITSVKLVTLFGRVELEGSEDGRDLILANDDTDIPGRALSVQGTIVGNWTITLDYGRTVEVDLWDVLLVSGAGLADLGALIGHAKVDTAGNRDAGTMLGWYLEDPEGFQHYSQEDAKLTALAFDAITQVFEDHDLALGKTIGSVFAQEAAKRIAESDYGDLLYTRKKVWDGIFPKYKLVPTKTAERYLAALHGGRNETYVCGRFNGPVVDYDLKGAYNAVMGMLPAVEHEGNGKLFTDADELYKYGLTDPLALAMVVCRFKYPEGTWAPGIPIEADNGLQFPLEGISSEFHLQEFLVEYPHLEGCDLVGSVMVQPTKGESVIAHLSRDLKQWRNDAKDSGNKLADRILKLTGNSGYGKFSQGYRDKNSIDLANSTPTKIVRSPIPQSAISNPAWGGYIPAFCRAVMSEYLHYCEDKGYTVLSMTTDGFNLVDDVLPPEAFGGVGILGNIIRDKYETDIIEEKRSGQDFIALKTRGYAMITSSDPLVAMTGVQVRRNPNESEEGYHQRKAAFLVNEHENVTELEHTKYLMETPPSMAAWIAQKAPPTFIEKERGYNFDYDLKRRPVGVHNDEHGRIKFTTIPWPTVDEYLLYRGCYQDYRRGERSESTETAHGNKVQVGVKNKILTAEAWQAFEAYVATRRADYTNISRINTNTHFRILANLAKRLLPEGTGFKKIASALNIDHHLTRYWLQKPDKRMSDLDLSRPEISQLLDRHLEGANSEPRKSLYSQFAPKDFVNELRDLWLDWTTPDSGRIPEPSSAGVARTASAEGVSVGITGITIRTPETRVFRELLGSELWTQ